MYMINRVKAVWQFITSPDYSRTVSILALLVVVLAIPLTVFIAQKQQEIRQRAQTVLPTQCPSTYDGQTLADQLQEAKDAYKDNETQWIQDHNSKLAQETPQATDKQTLFNAKCEEISSFYSYYRSQGVPLSDIPQRWVNERNAIIGASTPTSCNSISLSKSPAAPGELINVTLGASANSYNMVYGLPSTSLLASQTGSGTFLIQAPSTPGAYNIVVNTYNNNCSYFCDYKGNWQRNTTQREGSLCPAEERAYERVGGCTNNCGTTLVVAQAAPTVTPTAPPPTATPIILPPTTPTLIVTPTPTPVALCGHRCNSFTSGSKTRVADCDFADTYLDVSETNGVCTGSCAQIPVGYRKTPDGCEAVSTFTGLPRVPAPPSSPGDNNPPAPTPTPGGTLASLSVSLPGIGNRELDVRTPRRASRAIRLSIFNQNNLNNDVGGGNGSFTFDGRAFSGTVSLGSIPTGDYLIKAEMEMNTLKTLIPGTQHIVAGTTNQLSAVILIPGDLDKNNVLDIRDYNMLVSVFGGGRDTPADLNDDGVVNGTDYNIFLRSLKEKRQGD